MTFHRGGTGAERHTTLDLVVSEGGDLGRVILGHSDEIADDLETLVSDKRLGQRASPSKARRRQRRYKNRMINEILKIERN